MTVLGTAGRVGAAVLLCMPHVLGAQSVIWTPMGGLTIPA
jgi:hypothetical protein